MGRFDFWAFLKTSVVSLWYSIFDLIKSYGNSMTVARKEIRNFEERKEIPGAIFEMVQWMTAFG